MILPSITSEFANQMYKTFKKVMKKGHFKSIKESIKTNNTLFTTLWFIIDDKCAKAYSNYAKNIRVRNAK